MPWGLLLQFPSKPAPTARFPLLFPRFSASTGPLCFYRASITPFCLLRYRATAIPAEIYDDLAAQPRSLVRKIAAMPPHERNTRHNEDSYFNFYCIYFILFSYIRGEMFSPRSRIHYATLYSFGFHHFPSLSIMFLMLL